VTTVALAGWAIPDRERIVHYFVDTTSLCRAWRYTGPTHDSRTPPTGMACRICAERTTR